MSSDGMDSGATWQAHQSNGQDDEQPVYTHQQPYYYDAAQAEYVASPQGQPFIDADAYASTSQGGSEYQEGYHGQRSHQPAETRENQPSQMDQRLEVLRTLGQYMTYIGAPFIFGGLTALLVLPLVASGRAAAPQIMFWPLVVLIILITIAQGTTVYYLGATNDLWFPFTLIGLFLFLLVGSFGVWGALPGFLVLILIVALCVFLVRRYFQSVPEGFVVIVSAFGKYRRTLFPGPHLLLPWERVVQELNVGETQWICPTQRVQLSRDEDVILRAAISYQLLPEDAYLAVTQVNAWETNLRELFLAAIQTIATTFSPTDFISWPEGVHAHPALNPALDDFSGGARWEQVNGYLHQYMSEQAATWGVQINWIRIRDVSLSTHGTHIVDAVPFEQTPLQVEQYDTHYTPSSTPQTKPEPVPTSPSPVFKEEVLIKAYKQVQDGNISDPQTIRSLARRFEAIAHDPSASQSVSFDPLRAAENLYAEADRNEQRFRAADSAPQDTFDDNTNPNWQARSRPNPNDEHMVPGN